VAILADAPPKEILIARLLGTLQSPLAQLASVLQEPVARLARALQGVHDQRAGAATTS
jgi:large subunit ribosomal protein L10